MAEFTYLFECSCGFFFEAAGASDAVAGGSRHADEDACTGVGGVRSVKVTA